MSRSDFIHYELIKKVSSICEDSIVSFELYFLIYIRLRPFLFRSHITEPSQNGTTKLRKVFYKLVIHIRFCEKMSKKGEFCNVEVRKTMSIRVVHLLFDFLRSTILSLPINIIQIVWPLREKVFSPKGNLCCRSCNLCCRSCNVRCRPCNRDFPWEKEKTSLILGDNG